MQARILVVDDESYHTALLTRVLGRSGFEVFSAHDGVDALTQIKEMNPDLVLLDVAMPGMDGYAVCRSLRSDVRWQSVPVIFLTAKADLPDCLQGFEAGGDDYLVKPCDISEIKARVESMLRRRRRDLWSHPLTRLPGSPSIEEEVRQRLTSGKPFAFAYLDIDHFKSYNDAYGYDAGDQVIRDVGRLLMACCSCAPDIDPYAGHIGGDDFVFIASVEGMKEVLPMLTAVFDAKRDQYYRPDEVQRGGLSLPNRQGNNQLFPLITFSIAVVSSQHRHIPRYPRLVEIATEIKRYLKGSDHEGKSLIMWDRRSDFPQPAPSHKESTIQPGLG